MSLFKFLILLACVTMYKSQWKVQRYNWNMYDTKNYNRTSNRILELMRSYYEEATSRITHMNPMRFMFEESPHYEMGYITGEIIERYRKVVEHTQKPTRFRFYTMLDTLKHVELTQKLYFELYHLVRMIHETPRKWRGEAEFQDIEKEAGPDLLTGLGIHGKGKQVQAVMSQTQLQEMYNLHQRLLDLKKHQERERKRRRKKYEKIRQAFLSGVMTDLKGTRQPFPKPWPIDYGWEINETLW